MSDSKAGLEDPVAACLDVSRSVVVRACAGSGKTWLLTSRIIRIIYDSPGLPLSSILAITYTNNAAAEIRARVVSRLRELRDAGDARLDALLGGIGIVPGGDSRERARAMHDRFIIAHPRLEVRTFHGWFNHIVSHLPWELRLNQNRQVMNDASALRERAWGETVRAFTADGGDGGALRGMLGFHKLGAMRRMLDSMLDRRTEWFLHFGLAPEDEGMEELFAERLAEGMPRPGGKGIDEIVADGSLADAALLVAGDMKRHGDGKMDGESAALRSAATLGGKRAFYGVCRAIRTKKGRGDLSKTLAKKWDKRVAIPDSLYDLDRMLGVALEVENWKLLREYNELACKLGSAYARRCEALKRSEGVIDFSDMELAPMRAMAGGDGNTLASLEMLERMDARYRHILVDEFQDTSPVQWKLLRSWLEMSEGGDNQPSVFVVGDPKQSIYGFRGGNPLLLDAAARFLGERYGGETVEFNTTRRCSQEVVDVVNELFSHSGRPLVGFSPHDTLAEGSGRAVCVVPGKEGSRPAGKTGKPERMRNPLREAKRAARPEEQAEAEGRRIARCLRELLPAVRVAEPGGGSREAGLGDVLLLMPSRANSRPMIDALIAAGMPCSAIGSVNRLRDLECRDVVALLKSIYDPGYGLAVAHVLRSPVFSATEDDLWAVRQAGLGGKGGCDWVRGLRKAKGSEALGRAQELLGKWRDEYRRQKLPAHETLARCYHDAGLVGRYMDAVPDNIRMRVAQNLEWVLNLAIEADGGRHAQLAEYAEHLEGMAGAETLQGDAAGDLPDMIRTMTVHKSKGLESPVVVLANADFNDRNPEAGLVVGWGPRGLGGEPSHVSFVRDRSEASGSQAEALDWEEDNRLREKSNLLYVAATRAKSLLVVSAREYTRTPSQLWGNDVAAAMARLGAGAWGEGGMSYGSPGPAGEAEVASGTDVPEAGTEPLEPYRGGEPVGSMSPRISVKARRGTLLHNLLAMRLSGIGDGALLRRMLAVGEREFAELSAETNRILDPAGGFGGLLGRADSVEAEVPLSAGDVQMRIDCLLREGDVAWVVDFKTGSSVGTDEHAAQLKGYAEFLRADGRFGSVRAALVDVDGALTEVG